MDREELTMTEKPNVGDGAHSGNQAWPLKKHALVGAVAALAAGYVVAFLPSIIDPHHDFRGLFFLWLTGIPVGAGLGCGVGLVTRWLSDASAS